MARQGSGTGQGGKSYQDRMLAASVRKLALEEIEHVLKNRKHKLYGPVLVKLAGSVLPRLNEHSGPDGEPLFDDEAKAKARAARAQVLGTRG